MEIRRNKRTKNVVICSLSETYPHDVNLYKEPPTFEVSMSEFERLAYDRLKLLRIVENASVRLRVYSESWKQQIYEDLLKENLKEYYKLIKSPGFGLSENEIERRKNDHISHFIMLLAHSQSDGTRYWILQRELELFRLRFSNMSAEGLQKFIETNQLKYRPISSEEKNTMIERLRDSTLGLSPVQIETSDFYKVPFWEVPDLVKNMRVFLKAGYAYVPSSELISIVINMFRTTVSLHLTLCISAFDEYVDNRVRPLLENLFKTYTGEDFSTPTDTNDVPVFMLDTLSQQSYPLCMRRIHEDMMKNSHLKYHARQQYQLFLKGIGVTMESCLQFFRQVFSKKVDPDKFDKQYAYNIRHNYGQEGSRTNYKPKGCVTLINSTVDQKDCHGCPFRHEDPGILKKKLIGYGITTLGADEVMDLVKHKHYQIACSKYFEFTHKNTPITITHPNQYFIESRKIRLADNSNDKNTLSNKFSVKNKMRPMPKALRPPQVSSQRNSTQSSENTPMIMISKSNPSSQNNVTDVVSPDMDWDDDSFDVAMLEDMDSI